ncbi:cytochrome c oxidase polypeptide IV [Apiospora aurea]|uniref:Cytochrome c oxidase polypeptide IV n=1 Tax=Apiospora aurea TaxID=335848 RepID=A0ABR1QXA9_9PEZI
MFLQRTAVAAARRAAVTPVIRRSFTASVLRRDAGAKNVEPHSSVGQKMKALADVKTEDDLIGPGAAPGTVPTDLEQSTGLERLEILGKMEGVDIFDMRPLDASRKGTIDNPIMVKSAGDEQYAGCTGYPADSHVVHWLGMSRERPMERCPECGSVYKMEYVGPQDDGHGHHDHHGYEEPKTFADYVKPQYW